MAPDGNNAIKTVNVCHDLYVQNAMEADGFFTNPCEACDGKNWVENPHPLAISIPPGIELEGRICFPALGQPVQNGGPSGNLYIDVSVRRHNLFTRFGSDISLRYPVRTEIAETGYELKIPSPEGVGYFTQWLPPKTTNGATFKNFEADQFFIICCNRGLQPQKPICCIANKRNPGYRKIA